MTTEKTCDQCGATIPDGHPDPFLCDECSPEYCDQCGEPLEVAQIGVCDECRWEDDDG